MPFVVLRTRVALLVVGYDVEAYPVARIVRKLFDGQTKLGIHDRYTRKQHGIRFAHVTTEKRKVGCYMVFLNFSQ